MTALKFNLADLSMMLQGYVCLEMMSQEVTVMSQSIPRSAHCAMMMIVLSLYSCRRSTNWVEVSQTDYAACWLKTVSSLWKTNTRP